MGSELRPKEIDGAPPLAEAAQACKRAAERGKTGKVILRVVDH